ncbi:MAG: FeoA domain-containing protein [Puniceicoccales bacterium]|jgi:ferrous iron transport protein A|nr:FeoA domain-containing protein [Puniceicoccales bacterium]
MKLSELPLKRMARVTRLRAENTVDQRLLALGLLPGMLVKVAHVAPLGDPLAIEFQNQCVSVRKNEADSVEVEVL